MKGDLSSASEIDKALELLPLAKAPRDFSDIVVKKARAIKRGPVVYSRWNLACATAAAVLLTTGLNYLLQGPAGVELYSRCQGYSSFFASLTQIVSKLTGGIITVIS